MNLAHVVIFLSIVHAVVVILLGMYILHLNKFIMDSIAHDLKILEILDLQASVNEHTSKSFKALSDDVKLLNKVCVRLIGKAKEDGNNIIYSSDRCNKEN